MRRREAATTRVYRLTLRALPGELAAGAEEIATSYDELAAEARRSAGRQGEWSLLSRSLVGLLVCVTKERFERRRTERETARGLAVGAGDRHHRSKRGPVDMLLEDVRHSLRSLRRQPRFALGVVLLVALGVGAVTAVFSAVDGVLLRALPYPQADRLVFFGSPAHSGPKLEDWSTRLTAVDRLGAAWVETVALTGVGAPQRVREGSVSEGFFDLFGARPALGRLLVEGDFAPGSRVVVLAHSLWQSQFGAERDIVGRAITVDGVPLDVVGVLERGFLEPEALTGDRVDLWVALDRSQPVLTERNVHVLQVAGRLAEGTSLEAAQEELDALSSMLAEEFPGPETDREGNPREVPLQSLHEATVDQAGSALTLLLGAVGAMLLISCANVASLALARVSDRGRELSLRSALGASRARVGSLLLIESLLLAIAGGILGLGFAWIALDLFRRFAPAGIPRLDEVAVDFRVIVFAFALSLLTGLLFGVAPALRSARADVALALREQSTGPTRSRQRLRGALVVVQVALALALSVGSALLFHSFLRLRAVELGFEPERVVRLHLQHGQFGDDQERIDRRLQLADALLEEVAALPGVEGAAFGWSLPFDHVGGSRCCWRTRFVDSAVPVEEAESRGEDSMVNPVTPDFFRVLGVPVLEGRALVAADRDSEPPAVVLNRELADRLFPQGAAVGSLVRMGREQSLQVVGVVADFKAWGLDQESGAAAFLPYERFGGRLPTLSLAVRSSLPLAQLAESLRRTVWQLDPDLPIDSIVELEQRISSSIATPRFYSALLLVFAAMAMALAAAGIYGSLLFAVGQRVREMGVRMALGAARGNVVRLIVGQGLMLVAIGLGLGLLASLAGGRVLEARLFEVAPNDPLAMAVASGVLIAVSLLACWVPARRAAATNPVETLRAD
ncbi:MAG TPA: ABC transporter permease [Thermoanaerobaculia bacterium]|nr:ABC transporter permease [Thermoanaerobaculia bacterium]